MDENLIGYLLDALDAHTRSQVEVYLQTHPEAREKLALLRQALVPLALDQEAPHAPAQLAERTLARIAEHACSSDPAADLPQAPPLSPARLAGGRTWWRRADLAAAACVFLMVAGLGLTALMRLRSPASPIMIAECKNNLLRFFTALEQYRDVHKNFPDVSREEPRNVAGMVVPILVSAGTLPPDALIRCPGNGAPMACDLTLTSLRTMNDADFARVSPCLSMCYAYSLGYRDEEGTYHAPGSPSPSSVSLSQAPIMADRPPSEGVVRNSVNHGGAGQNVLFLDGHVLFLPERTLGNGDDIFLNRDLRVAAGLDANDIVLGYSAARP